MIFTSNLTPDKWRDFFREEDSLLCALDRTFDAATVYLMKGESYRGRNLKTYSIEISDPAEYAYLHQFLFSPRYCNFEKLVQKQNATCS